MGSNKLSGTTGAEARNALNGSLPGQVVLVLQGGGALGAFQFGVAQALYEAGIRPDWVIGTSIGAINGAILAGNRLEHAADRLAEFWDRVAKAGHGVGSSPLLAAWSQSVNNLHTLGCGVPNFFAWNPVSAMGPFARLGVEQAAYYRTDRLRGLLSALIDFEHLAHSGTRLTVGAVNARSGRMRYFDNRHERLELDHVMASGALPPAFPAVRIEGEPYWDGGIYSNTPMEVVFDDHPRRSSLIFAVNLWNPQGEEPQSLWDVQGRAKDIQYASRYDNHVMRHLQTHHLRHVIMELTQHIPAKLRNSAEVKELSAWGCATTMHIVRLMVPRQACDDHTKDIDFSRSGIEARRRAGYEDARRALQAQPWQGVENAPGVVVHDFEGKSVAVAA